MGADEQSSGAKPARPKGSRTLGAFIAAGGGSVLTRVALLSLLCLALFLPGLAEIGPSDRDESRFAQATKQMLETGDYVDIRFQEDPRHKKPAGIYWLQAAGVAALGGPEQAEIWMYRLPSVLGALLAVLLTSWAVRPLVGARAGMLAAVMTASCVLLAVEARIAKTDAMLLAAIVAAMGALARLWFQTKDDPAERGVNVFVFWTALAAGVMLKGPIILMPIGGALLWMMLYERSLRGLGRLGAGWGFVWLLLLAVPWYAAIGVQTGGAFFQASVGEDLLAKVAQGQENHGAPPGAYFLAFFGTFWPWTILAVLALPWIWRWRAAPETAFMLGWIVPTWIAFELVSTKLPHYVLPVYPAIAAMAAAAALDGSARPSGWLFRIGSVLWAAPALALPAAAAAGPILVAGAPSIPAAGLAAAAALALLWAWRELARGVWLAFVRAAVLGAGLLYVAIFHFTLPALQPVWVSERMVAAAEPFRACIAEQLGERPALASVRYHEPSLVFLAGTDTRLVSGEDAAAYLAETPGALVWLQDKAVKLEKRLFEGAELEDRPEAAAFAEALNRLGVVAIPLADLEGYNYNRGRLIRTVLYGREGDPAVETCRRAN